MEAGDRKQVIGNADQWRTLLCKPALLLSVGSSENDCLMLFHKLQPPCCCVICLLVLPVNWLNWRVVPASQYTMSRKCCILRTLWPAIHMSPDMSVRALIVAASGDQVSWSYKNMSRSSTMARRVLPGKRVHSVPAVVLHCWTFAFLAEDLQQRST